MKRFTAFALCALLVLTTASTTDSSASKGRAVKQQLTALFAACRSEDNAKAAKYIVYRGPDERRREKDRFDYANAAEKAEVDKVCKAIGVYLTLDRSPKFVRFAFGKQGKEEWGIWELVFEARGQRERVLFAFVKVKGKYLLGDIDNLRKESDSKPGN